VLSPTAWRRPESACSPLLIHHAYELDQDAVASGFYDPATVRANRRIDDFAPQGLNTPDRALLVSAGQAAISDHVSGQDRTGIARPWDGRRSVRDRRRVSVRRCGSRARLRSFVGPVVVDIVLIRFIWLDVAIENAEIERQAHSSDQFQPVAGDRPASVLAEIDPHRG
jgi:hypothetical protein